MFFNVLIFFKSVSELFVSNLKEDVSGKTSKIGWFVRHGSLEKVVFALFTDICVRPNLLQLKKT